MIRRSNAIVILLAVAAIAAVAVPSQADLYYLKTGFGSSNWGIPSDWNSQPDGLGTDATVMAGNDFDNNGNVLGTPGGDATFAGDSLTLSGGALNLRNGGTKSVADLTATGGAQIYSNAAGTIIHAASFVNASGTTNLFAGVGSTGDQTVFFNFDVLTGSANIELSGGSSGYGRIADLTVSDGSGFTGDIGWQGTNGVTLKFGNGATFAGSLTVPGTARITLDQNVTFAAVTINGDSLAEGTYSYATLNATYDTIFNDGGSGSITVVPEPTSLGLLAAGALALVRRRRRSA